MKIRILIVTLTALLPIVAYSGYLIGYIHANKVISVDAAAYSSERALAAASLIRDNQIDKALTILESHGINYGKNLLDQDVSIFPNLSYIKIFLLSPRSLAVDSLLLHRAQNKVSLYTARYPESTSSAN